MNNNSSSSTKTAGIIRFSCGLLFALYSFTYLYFIQGELLAEAQYVFSKGVTTYSIFVGALIITFVLQVIQMLIARIQHLPDKWYSLSYAPSFILLTLLTDINTKIFDYFSFGAWTWVFPLLVAVYIIIVLLINKLSKKGPVSEETDFSACLWPNYAILLVMMLFTGTVSGTHDVYLYELKTERLIINDEYNEALDVGKKSLASSRRLTELRMYALARTNQLGERLFDYPQNYSADGLLDVSDTSSHYRFSNQHICCFIGAQCGKTIKTTERYLDIMVERDTLGRQPLGDYYLCSLLLKKDLDAFTEKLSKYYETDSILPRAYKEALILKLGKDEFLKKTTDSLTVSHFNAYRQMADTIADSRERENRLRRKFGTTYWWYFDYAAKE